MSKKLVTDEHLEINHIHFLISLPIEKSQKFIINIIIAQLGNLFSFSKKLFSRLTLRNLGSIAF